ncbi:hypothetical protein ABL78_7258 [Leptomonas seymouri]|uniref:Uncharacterized protein n=1 Tax=Leptomonas seymouri TaxID=5684 RepID=A0A0N1HU78_LEPSE|nr:hypothetical protein ABL78_7258 [Leptomonas seymouri]|eukprot:KPI83690.1 hypothetical protein ABL78_7258 [Leptomonas seymouri]
MGRCRWVLRTVRRRHTTAALFSVMLVGLYLALRGLGVDPTARAMMWVALFLVVPSFQQPQARQEDRRVAPAAADVELPQHGADAVEVRFPADFVAARLSAEGGSWHAQHLPGMLYAGVYMIQLHPFFTVRNAIVSHTLDDVSTVDARNYAVEGGLLVLLCCAATAPLLPVFRFRLMGCYVGVLSSAMSLSAVAWMLVHPVESFQVLPALLWCFPSFLLATLSVALS